MTVEAKMAERTEEIDTTTIPVVDTGAETIFLGAGHGLVITSYSIHYTKLYERW